MKKYQHHSDARGEVLPAPHRNKLVTFSAILSLLNLLTHLSRMEFRWTGPFPF